MAWSVLKKFLSEEYRTFLKGHEVESEVKTETQ